MGTGKAGWGEAVRVAGCLHQCQMTEVVLDRSPGLSCDGALEQPKDGRI